MALAERDMNVYVHKAVGRILKAAQILLYVAVGVLRDRRIVYGRYEIAVVAYQTGRLKPLDFLKYLSGMSD